MQTEPLKDFMTTYKGPKESGAFKVSFEKDIAIVTFDFPGQKVNKWSTASMVAFYDVMDVLEAKKPKAAILISAKENIFIAGADLDEIKVIKTAEEAQKASELGQRIFERWEGLPFPTVAAIHGAALGGGCEFALSCTVRVCTDDSSTKIGLPEVMLGILPGWGGTQRLPRMVGLATSLDLILGGNPVDARKAKKIGLVQDVMPKELLLATAMTWARRIVEKPFRKYELKRDLKSALIESALFRSVVFQQARKQVLSKTMGNYPAPLGALKTVQRTYSVGKPFRHGFRVEAEEFGRLAMTPESKNLVQLFFLSELAKKTRYPLEPKTPVKGTSIEVAAVLGAGVMGAGIAFAAARKGTVVYLKDVSEDALAKGLAGLAAGLNKLVKRRKIKERDKAAQLAFIRPVTNMQGMEKAQLIVEAIVENLDVKQKVFSELESVIAKDAVLATNTSTLSVKAIAAKSKHPERIVGLHFFNPVDKMPLVEIITTDVSSDLAVSTALDFAKKLGKTPVVCKDSPGFIVNRILGPYLNEAGHLASTGVNLELVDRTIKKFGMPMGPYRLMDEVGLDVCVKAGHILHSSFGDRLRPKEHVDAMVKQNKLGRKNGSGFYTYEGKKETFDEGIYSLLKLSSPKSGATSTEKEQWVKRLLYPMINEAARVLEEGVADRPETVDIAMIFGTGFAPFRGGPLRWADSIGISKIVADLEEMGTQFGARERFEPARLLVTMAREHKTFYKDTV